LFYNYQTEHQEVMNRVLNNFLEQSSSGKVPSSLPITKGISLQ